MSAGQHFTACHLGCCAGLPPARPGETPWLCGRTQPVQPGVYRRLYSADVALFCLWDVVWNGGGATPDEATEWPYFAADQELPWCGRLTPPPGGYAAHTVATVGAAPC